jgi:Ni,Fe-hydrogenase I cytochrome b subunit
MEWGYIIKRFKDHHWPTIIGWAGFWLLFVATATGNYIFDPFIFGFSYYSIYLLTQLGKTKKPEEVENNSQRILILAIVCLVYMSFLLSSNMNKRIFLSEFDNICWGLHGYAHETSLGLRICEEIQSSISNNLSPESDKSYQ